MNKFNFLAVAFFITGIISPIADRAEVIGDRSLNNPNTQQTTTSISIAQNSREGRNPTPGTGNRRQENRFRRINNNLFNTPPIPNTSQLQTTRGAVADQEQDWKKDYEDYIKTSFSNPLMSSKAISETLSTIEKKTGKKSAVVYLIPKPKQLEIILVTSRNKPVSKSIQAANRDALLKISQQFKTEISDLRRVDTTSYLASAQQLYQWLIAPIEKELKAENIDTLVFCVGVGLRSVPFAALHDGKKFLVENYSISLIPAFSLTDTRYTDIRDFSVLAMGASQFKDLAPLPAVPIELSTIVRDKGGTSFLNDKFTLENLRSQRQQQSYKIIHLATHGVFQPGAVNNSYIQLWNTKLHLNQLRQLQLNNPPVDLLVLSACKTALGDEQAELGFSGLALEAGVKSAMGSLWNVSDAGTLVLMTEFYQYLKTSPVKAEALRQTQIRMLKGQIKIEQGQLRQTGLRTGTPLPPELSQLGDLDLSHPYYWAGFTMIGSPW
ncbi:CHAT domain-containing protein [Nostocaceae cyanobacterium CENA369]|uniref:CHAT domain-containing protein n=1 Tax=Dendronalium phyllosphericum CENA369 TaxID=1725256 RepID=A0A8J7LEQ0_9NOST|nr:CHAT domain-containing protein [Dendronalium phyllosphericum]MBH8574406.1 CHAT domain-containing protein [Dendronalium phyllosphericum CENA369]